MIASLAALGRVLRRATVVQTSVAALLEGHEGYLAFRRVVREVFPDAEAEILGAAESGGSRENARVGAFLHRVEAAYFPVYELDEYDQVACGIPFVRNAWSYDRFHELDLRPGELLLFALCAQPYETGYDSRVPLLAATEAYLPPALLGELPTGGFTPAELRERLDGTPYATAADYADWLWGETDTVFLDLDEEMEADIEWTHENVLELAAQWRRARDILDRTGDLAGWLEADPPARFARLLAATLGQDAHLSYERTRRYYACEVTEQGLVQIPHDVPDAVALPLGATPEAEIEDDPLRLRLDFHTESVLVHDYADRVVRTKLVSALDVAHALARELDLASGILPPDTLWWARTASGVRVAVWREPRVRTVRLRERYDAKPRRLQLPLPGLVFVCLPARQAPYVFAARARPRGPDDLLYHCPTYNVFPSGRVCPGSHHFPADPSRVPEEFFRSYFSATGDTAGGKSRRHPQDIGALWAELHGQATYPLDDLVPLLRVADALGIGT